MTDNTNDNLGVSVSGDIGAQELEYQRLGKGVNRELANLRNLLMGLKGVPQLQSNVAVIDNFLVEFNKFLAFPRIVSVMNEKVVNNTEYRDRLVKVPTRTTEDERRNFASAVLIDKLLSELKRVKNLNPNVQYNLDPEILEIFGAQLEPLSSKYPYNSNPNSSNYNPNNPNYNQILDEYYRAIFTKFNTAGPFTIAHQQMLK